MSERSFGSVDPTVPNFARVMDYLADGKDNFAVDRAVGDELLAVAPDVPTMIAELRRFLRAAVVHLVEQGIRQFVDVGCGLPTRGSVHEVLEELGVEGSVVYVDEDPVAVLYGQAVVANHGKAAAAGRPVVRVIQADPRDTDAMLDQAERTGLIDLRQPTGIIVRALLAVFADDVAAKVAGRLVDRLAPGGHLVLSHVIRDPCQARTEEMIRIFNEGALIEGDRGQVRTRAEVAAFLDGLDLVPPGLVPLPAWRPGFGGPTVDPDTFWNVGAVGRKP